MEKFQWELLIPLGAMVMIAWVVYAIVDVFRQWYKHRVIGQFQAKLLDRITLGQRAWRVSEYGSGRTFYEIDDE